MITLSVVVPATDDPPTLDRCLASLSASDDRADEVLVVTDPSLSASAARNDGAARAVGDVVVFVDADVEVHPDALGRIRRTLDGSPDLGAVFGSYDDSPDHRSVVSAFRNLLHHHVHHRSAGPAETFWTGLGAVRREAFLAVGGFDEARYPHPSIEDIELGERLRAAGHTAALDPAILGTHLKVWTLRSMVTTDFARRAVPWVSLQVRQRRLSGTLNCGWRHRLSAVASVVAVVAALLALVPVVAAGVAALVGLNAGFYGLLLRRLGPAHALAGIALHGLHHLVAVAAVPVGVVLGLRGVARRSDVAPGRVPALGAEA
ncbi:MAG TPA: glycosyltransferase [Acidimicrobiales bacterium]|nr:glycosyltransferase [Acidimicrobiales bacterium]